MLRGLHFATGFQLLQADQEQKGFYHKSWGNHDKYLAPVQKEARLFIAQGLNIT